MLRNASWTFMSYCCWCCLKIGLYARNVGSWEGSGSRFVGEELTAFWFIFWIWGAIRRRKCSMLLLKLWIESMQSRISLTMSLMLRSLTCWPTTLHRIMHFLRLVVCPIQLLFNFRPDTSPRQRDPSFTVKSEHQVKEISEVRETNIVSEDRDIESAAERAKNGKAVRRSLVILYFCPWFTSTTRTAPSTGGTEVIIVNERINPSRTSYKRFSSKAGQGWDESNLAGGPGMFRLASSGFLWVFAPKMRAVTIT